MDYRINARNLAANDVEKMAAFYAGVFGIEFEEHEIQDAKLYAGEFAGTEFVLVPAALADVDAKQNRMQYDLYVSDLDEAIALVEQHGGRTNGRLGEDDHVRAIGIYDPDDNFMVFKQPKTPA